MGTTEIGAMIVSLRTESAQFRAEMDGAKKKIKEVGAQSATSAGQIAKIASEGFGAILPIGNQAENVLEKLLQKATGLGGAFSIAGKASILFGAGLTAMKVGQYVGEFLSLGMSVEKYNESIRKAAEEQNKFLEPIRKMGESLRSLKAELAAVRGDESGKAVADAERRRAAIEAATVGNPQERARQLAISNQILIEEQEKFYAKQKTLADENEQKVYDKLVREREAQLKSWEQQTQFYQQTLQKRVELRVAFDKQLGEGGLPSVGGSAAQGFAALRKLQEQIRKEARDLAELERRGLISQSTAIEERNRIQTRALQQAQQLRAEFGHFPEVLEAINDAMVSVNFGNFGLEMENARKELELFVPTVDALKEAHIALGKELKNLPAAADPTSVAVKQLTRDYINLGNAIYFVVNAQDALVAE